MSRFSAERQISYESVAEHIANKKPPSNKNSLIFNETASFWLETFLNPNKFARFSKLLFWSIYHGVFLNEK